MCPEAAVPMVAEALNLSRAEVHGVVTFYHDFRPEPRRPARAEALPCRGLPGGGRRGAGRTRRGAGSASASARPRADGASRSKAVYCLGLCAIAPSAMLDGRVVGRLDERRLDALLAEAQR